MATSTSVSAANGSVSNPASAWAGRWGWAVACLLLVTSVLLVSLLIKQGSHGGQAVWFVALLVIFASVMALVAIVFRALDMGNPAEAFGLPAGSVRTLLAVGTMLLFSVFGLNLLGMDADAPGPRLAALPEAKDIPVAADNLAAEIKRYTDAGLVPVVVQPALPAMPASGNQPATEARAALLRLMVSNDPRPISAPVLEVGKQIITALIALLTTVVGFYFGSRTAEGARDAKADPPAADGAKAAAAAQAAQRQGTDLSARLTQATRRLSVEQQVLNEQLQRDTTKLADAAAFKRVLGQADEGLKQASAALAAAQPLLGALEPLRAALAKAADGAAAQSAQSAWEAAYGPAKAAVDKVQSLLDSLDGLLQQAKAMP